MYLVVSRWEAVPGQEDEVRRRSAAVRSVLRAQPGVEMVHSVFNGSSAVAVHGYTDEAAYQRVVHDPNGAFAQAVAANKMEEVASWQGSDAGYTAE